MKVAFSASWWKVNEVRDVLHSCDMIFTTMWENLKELQEEFGDHKINLLPHGYDCARKAIKDDIRETYPDAEILEHGDLYKIFSEVLSREDESSAEAIRVMGLKYFGLYVGSEGNSAVYRTSADSRLICEQSVSNLFSGVLGAIPAPVLAYIATKYEGE